MNIHHTEYDPHRSRHFAFTPFAAFASLVNARSERQSVVVVDTHVHLDDTAFADDRMTVLARAHAAGVSAAVVPAIDMASWAPIHALCHGRDDLWPAYGLHPLFLNRHQPLHIAALNDWLDHHPAVAVGEIGLDFYVPGLDPDLQRTFFQQQLQLAHERDLPVIVHARRAVEEVLLALRKLPGLRGVVHSFAGSEQQASQFWKIGFLLGIGGPVTYERARRLRRVVAGMPVEQLLLETDAPDQPDANHRGQRNEPARVIEVLQCVARLRGESVDAVASATTANARRLFGR